MAKAFNEMAANAEAEQLSHGEWLALLLDWEWSWRYNRKLGARLRFAKLRHQVAPKDVDYRGDRGLDRALFLKLIAGDWIDAHDNLAICRPSGVGKSWLACALGRKACREPGPFSISVSHACSPIWRSPDAMVATHACNARSPASN
ncbi:IstB-like ATP binding N-terminal [Mesorhizobium muleiense]|uniref:IstB-like ATP binding N-terminal n=1 Tax=Mesorhizobium muleiense TaxID=1004279 RepID=A0A1G9EYN0_9HYPH|nr:IstB-like ATP binding N-terminal [Mesorhizobium muleiense]